MVSATVSRQELTEARDAAIACVESAFAFAANLGLAHATAKTSLRSSQGEDEESPAADALHVKAAEWVGMLVAVHTRAFRALSPEVTDLLIEARNRHPEKCGLVQIGPHTYSSAHEAAVNMVYRQIMAILVTAQEHIDNESASAFIEDLGRLGEQESGERIRKALAGLSGLPRNPNASIFSGGYRKWGRQWMWADVAKAVDNEARCDLSAQIQREWGLGLSLLESGDNRKRTANRSLVLTQLQQAIRNALNGKALKKQPLADAVCAGEGSRLYRVGGLKELKEANLVCHKNGVGYYRPDAPPPDLIVPMN